MIPEGTADPGAPGFLLKLWAFHLTAARTSQSLQVLIPVQVLRGRREEAIESPSPAEPKRVLTEVSTGLSDAAGVCERAPQYTSPVFRGSVSRGKCLSSFNLRQRVK